MLKKIAAAAALAIVASTAAAADAPAFYVGADIGTTKISDVDDRENGYGVFAGYQIDNTFAIEANFRRLADNDDLGVNLKADQVGLSAIAAMPLTDAFSLYGRLGYNRITLKASASGASASEHENKVLYGVGLGYSFSPTVSARIEVQKPHSDLTNFSAGLVFKF